MPNKTPLNFSISKIKANPGEVAKIQSAYEAVKIWKDWSFSGVVELKQLLGKLRTFEESALKQSKSPTLGKLYHFVDETIKSRLPNNVRQNYIKANTYFSKNIDLVNEMYDAFNSGDTFKKLAQIFGKNNDSLRQIVKRYEQVSGEKFTSTLAGRELSAEGEMALFNPRTWLDAVVPPKIQASIITGSAKLGKKIAPTKSAIEKLTERLR